jgi:hypothetical protein
MTVSVLTAKQRKALEFLWFKYGNGGNAHSMANHRFFQLHVAGDHDAAAMHEPQITGECRLAFDRILKNDYSELSEFQKNVLKAYAAGVL